MRVLLVGVDDATLRARAARLPGVRVERADLDALGGARGPVVVAGRGAMPATLRAAGLRPGPASATGRALLGLLRSAGLGDAWVAERAAPEPRALARATTPREAPECVECGACCRTDNPRYVALSEDDLGRLAPREREALTWSDRDGSYLRLELARCAALRVEGGRALCAIYERRPDVCRAFARGGPGCFEARAGAPGRRLVAADPGPGRASAPLPSSTP